MAYDIPGLIKAIREFNPRILAGFSTEFSSSEPDHRKKIRAAVGAGILDLSEPERGGLLNLDQRPDLRKWSVSISHCAQLGGWIAAPLPLKVGLDIEIKERISDKIIQRIALNDELLGIPDPSFLWCAKEAYFKALAKDQPVAVTQLQVGDWRQVSPDCWTFGGSPQVRGGVFSVVDLLVSVCEIGQLQGVSM